jgi:opacity protein-like surface antigen
MRKWITLLMTLLVGSCVSSANANTGQVTLEAGYRHDNINWRTRFPSDSPFLKTNTKFKDLNIFQLGFHGRATVGCNFYVRANAYWGWILEGDFEQSVESTFSHGPKRCSSSSSQYYECSPICCSSSSSENSIDFGFSNDRHNVIDDKWVYGASAAIGYPFYFCDCTLVVAPVLGYSIDEQNIEIDDEGFDLHQSGYFLLPKSGSECCEHKWISRWFGGFVGLDFDYRPYNECWNIWGEFEYHFGNFQGKRHINSDFSGFGFQHHKFHSHDATGWVVSAGADYDLCNCWTVGLAVKFQDWSATRHHKHDDSFSDEASFGDCRGRERHNFKWHSYEVKLALGKEF